MMLALPGDVRALLDALRGAGYPAYVVGGCVRDSVLGRTPQDWDVCTAATPAAVRAALSQYAVVPTGLAHGTVTVVMAHRPYEVTTFRTEAGYSDHRRPDAVRFVGELREDLARRDFTINAMAYHPDEGLIDPFGGQADLVARMVRCVGEASARFTEDALRMLRALRFAAVYGFTLAQETAQAVHALCGQLRYVSMERVWAELRKLLCGDGAAAMLAAFPDALCAVLPELAGAGAGIGTGAGMGITARGRTGEASVGTGATAWERTGEAGAWRRTARAVGYAPAEPALRLALLCHGAWPVDGLNMRGEAACGLDARSEAALRSMLRRLTCDNATRARVLRVLLTRGRALTADTPSVLRLLRDLGEEGARDALAFRRADALASRAAGDGDADGAWADTAEDRNTDGARAGDGNTDGAWAGTAGDGDTEDARLVMLAACERTLARVLAEGRCYALPMLAVDGGDLLAAGVAPGRAVGAALRALLEAVIDGRVPNEKDALLVRAGEVISGEGRVEG